MDKNFNSDRIKTFINPIKWCHYIVNVGYATVAVITLAHVVWYFAARNILAYPAEIYLWHYIIFPFIGLFSLNLFVDFLVRSHRVPLIIKEYIALTLFIIFSFYLCLTHRIAAVLLGTFSLSVFASCIFSNIQITRWVLGMSSFALLLTGIKIYFEGKLDSRMTMELFVAWDFLLCSYLLAKALIRFSQDNLVALMSSYHQQQSMKEQLKLDPFTGLYNKKTFDDCLLMIMEECRRTSICLSLAMIDVDHFKQINDVLGHAAGDRVLLHLAHILQSNKTDNITVYRTGGEEFAIIFKDYCVKEAYKICDGMRSIMESSSSLREMDKKTVTFSCGIACMNLQHTSSAELLKAADSALYKAKNNGRNNVVIYDGSVRCINQKR